MERKLLLVDDDFEMLDELTEVFKDNGIEVIPAASGSQALAAAEKKDFAVALIDVKLPDFDGIDLAAKLRDQAPDAVYLMVTAYANVNNVIKALHKGVFDYIVKPVNIDELLVSVENAFSVKKNNEECRKYSDDLVKEKVTLEEKVLALERINKLLMGREKRIIELKKEVDSLLMRLGEKIKYGNYGQG